MTAAARSTRDYAVVTGAYWVFTLTDGALRMLVLLHLYALGHAPLEIASLFLLYEAFGVITNAAAGYIGARFGLRSTLFSGLGLQIVACASLAIFADRLDLPLLLAAQALAGVAKDLTKMSAKAWVKLLVPAGDSRGLMRWVSVLTGSKNALKGVGFFLGGLLLQTLGFAVATGGMAGALGLALLVALIALRRPVGKVSGPVKAAGLISSDARINWLAAARFFLFASRDVWFVLALPLFLGEALGWSHSATGAFLALWVIGYGIVQAFAPRFAGARNSAGERLAPTGERLALWTPLLILPLGGLWSHLGYGTPSALTLAAGLGIYGFVFAANSAVHSFLIVHYADGDRVALNVGFYYMANAAGRLLGTMLSGGLYQAFGGGNEGLRACLGGALALATLSTLPVLGLRKAELKHESAPESLAAGHRAPND